MLACRVRRERARQQSAVNSHVRRQDRDVNVRKQESRQRQRGVANSTLQVDDGNNLVGRKVEKRAVPDECEGSDNARI